MMVHQAEITINQVPMWWYQFSSVFVTQESSFPQEFAGETRFEWVWFRISDDLPWPGAEQLFGSAKYDEIFDIDTESASYITR